MQSHQDAPRGCQGSGDAAPPGDRDAAGVGRVPAAALRLGRARVLPQGGPAGRGVAGSAAPPGSATAGLQAGFRGLRWAR